MAGLSDIKVGAKLILGFGAVLLATVLVGGFSILQLSRLSDQSHKIANVDLTGVRDALLISEATTRYRVREYRLVMTKLEDRPAVSARLDAAIEAVNKNRKAYESSIDAGQEAELYQAFVQRWADYLVTSQQVRDKLMAGQDEQVMVLLTTDSLKKFDAVVESLKALSQFNDQSAQTSSDHADALYTQGRNLVLCAVALSLMGGVLLSLAIARSITQPLQGALSLAKSVAGGDLTQQLTAKGSDEVAQLTNALSTMVGQLRALVTEVRSGVTSVSSASSEIAMGSQDLSMRTEQAAASLQQTASSMEELTSTMGHASDTAQQANQLACHAAQSAQRGGQVVDQVVNNMGEITESSRKIGDIIGVIDGIAFQTNILALNAAVEAARAGEQGRGFAVVAGEVRVLAQRSAQAAKEIKTLINSSVDTVESGAQLVQSAGVVMKEIVTSVSRVTDLMGELAAAATEQREGIGQVNIAVANLDQMTQQNAALVEETAAAASSLSDQAVRLNQVVSVFNVGDQPAPALVVISPKKREIAMKSPVKAPVKSVVTVAKKPSPVSLPKPVNKPAPKLERPVALATAPADTADWETF